MPLTNPNINGQLILSAAGSWASVTNGASGATQVESTTNKVNYFVVDFLQSVKSSIEWQLALPADYAGGTINAIFYWLANSASANSVVWGLQAVTFANNTAIDAAFGTAQEVTQANQGTNIINITSTTAEITLAGTPVAGQHVQFRAYRLGSGADTLAATARLLEIKILYRRNI